MRIVIDFFRLLRWQDFLFTVIANPKYDEGVDMMYVN
jgi:hypothetical protein